MVFNGIPKGICPNSINFNIFHIHINWGRGALSPVKFRININDHGQLNYLIGYKFKNHFDTI